MTNRLKYKLQIAHVWSYAVLKSRLSPLIASVFTYVFCEKCRNYDLDYNCWDNDIYLDSACVRLYNCLNFQLQTNNGIKPSDIQVYVFQI